jgi:hypothetical protein
MMQQKRQVADVLVDDPSHNVWRWIERFGASSVVMAVAGSFANLILKSQVAVMLQSSSIWPTVASSLSLMVLSVIICVL